MSKYGLGQQITSVPMIEPTGTPAAGTTSSLSTVPTGLYLLGGISLVALLLLPGYWKVLGLVWPAMELINSSRTY